MVHALLSAAIIATTAPESQGGHRKDGLVVLRAQNAVEVNGETVHLEPRLFTILACLDDADGACRREDIFAALGEVYDRQNPASQDNRLNKDINTIRNAIGPHNIRTVNKVGYELVKPAAR